MSEERILTGQFSVRGGRLVEKLDVSSLPKIGLQEMVSWIQSLELCEESDEMVSFLDEMSETKIAIKGVSSKEALIRKIEETWHG